MRRCKLCDNVGCMVEFEFRDGVMAAAADQSNWKINRNSYYM